MAPGCQFDLDCRQLRLDPADPDLDDLEAHVEAQFQLQVIADVDNRRDAELARADAARERLAGGVRPATDAALWAPFRY